MEAAVRVCAHSGKQGACRLEDESSFDFIKSESHCELDAGDEQVLSMNNERFMVPEALFHPTDIGMNQAGVLYIFLHDCRT